MRSSIKLVLSTKLSVLASTYNHTWRRITLGTKPGWGRLSKMAPELVLRHELGHAMMQPKFPRCVLRRELEAWVYAYRKCGPPTPTEAKMISECLRAYSRGSRCACGMKPLAQKLIAALDGLAEEAK